MWADSIGRRGRGQEHGRRVDRDARAAVIVVVRPDRHAPLERQRQVRDVFGVAPGHEALGFLETRAVAALGHDLDRQRDEGSHDQNRVEAVLRSQDRKVLPHLVGRYVRHEDLDSSGVLEDLPRAVSEAGGQQDVSVRDDAS